MTAATACTGLVNEEKKQSFGHNAKMSALHSASINHNQDKTTRDFTANDPLEQIDQIEVVQQSDTNVNLIADEEVSADNNLSCLSIPPIQNLLGVFEENMNDPKKKCENGNKALLLSPEDSSTEKYCNTSPNGVEHYDDDKSSTARDEESEKKPLDDVLSSTEQSKYRETLKMRLPIFELHETLKIQLPQPVINRCSFYSVIHGVNKAVQDMAAEDQNGNIEETKDEDSALVLAVNGPAKVSSKRDGPQVELAVLDEEKFLLAAIESRDEEEMHIRACPATFAEAIGEVEPGVLSENQFNNGQSENPLSVLASSRTQLWKPSRSWWEAKSGKNPWIEPKNHNKRWRYLWPLIHYHKFLAKCIKKLKRNNVDVKTSLSPVSAFLREEVCAVSDHLASASKFTSEQWMEGLPHFNGWTKQDEESQNELNELVKRLPMRSLIEPADVDSSLLRNQIDVCFLKAMTAAREQMENGGHEGRNYEESSVNSDYSSVSKSNGRVDSIPNASKPPRHGGSKISRSNRSLNRQRSVNGTNRSWRNNRASNRMYGGYPPHGPNMMMHHPHMSQGMYPPHFNTSFNGSYVPGHYMPPSVNNSICGWNNPYGGNDYSNLNLSMNSEWDHQYYGGQYDPSMENEASFYLKCDDSVATNTSLASYHNFDVMQQNAHMHTQGSQEQSENGSDKKSGSPNTQEKKLSDSGNPSFDESSLNGGNNAETLPMQTPCKGKNNATNATPPSPSWAHLQMVPGLATPVTQTPLGHHPFDGPDNTQATGMNMNGRMRANSNWVNAKPLLINHNYNSHYPQGGNAPIPPSPATQFTMSPQANSQNTAYFAGHGYVRPNPSMQGFGSYMAPIQSYHQNFNHSETLPYGQTLTEATSSETTTSDNEN